MATPLDPRTVIASLEKLLGQGKDSALLRFSLGNEYFKLRETWVCIFHLKRAIELDPNYSAAWKLLGLALSEAQILHEALDTFRRGMAVAERRGDKQAAKEMAVFARRLEKQLMPAGK
jgi:tetratricopeptide (TPR) repeat protein